MDDALENFSPLTRAWFRATYGSPTPPQAQGWLPIQRGEHTLILAPTGSGKTLAAFLWGIDELFRNLTSAPSPAKRGEKEGIQLLYVSPLKALNNDIERNLRVPLEGIRAFAAREKTHLPQIRVAVRTGDTPASARASMLKHPPHILITTPESLYLMLTSPRAREMFRTTRTVIVDEIHTLAGNKRGVHLALSLERLQHLAPHRVQRIGLSATIKPLEQVAKFLGGQESRNQSSGISEQSPVSGLQSRPVTIVDARYKKNLALEIVTVVDDFRQLGGTDSIWAHVIPRVLNDIRTHNTTLIFSNNRRLAERTADRLNAQLEAEQAEEIEPGSPAALAPGGKMRDRGIFAIGAQGPIRAHHGSMSKEARREMEQELQAGKLPALVGTSSLELGMDIGAVDLVVQLQSPKSVAQGLQRVGRSGHLVGETSHGKIYATFREDLAEAAAIVRGMLEGDVEPTHTPQNALDVLAQQIVACVALEDWDADALYQMVRGAYPYQELSRNAYVSVLEMLTGKYFLDAPGVRAAQSLRPKIAWDRVRNRLTALPGSRLLAISNVGTIPDTGQYKVYWADNKTRLGELDEEFVFETRPGDTFLLGSQVWRALEIKDDRVIVSEAPGATPRMPFWRGDMPWRPYALGERIGKFRREVNEKLKLGDSDAREWLMREFVLDERSANNLLDYVQSQIHSIGAISSDKTIIVETFQNAVGDPHMVIHSPFGGRVNGAWAVALTSLIRERTGITPEVMTNDDGIIFRFNASDPNAPLELVTSLGAHEARERILRELPESAVFGAQFRMNAARALLLTKPRAGKRTPFWLQRLRAKDLLAYVKRTPEFPILIETYRDVLSDVFDLPHLELVLNRIASGEIQVITHESVVPSPVASGLLFNFVSTYLYEWDAPKAERNLQLLSVPRQTLQEVMRGIDWSELLKPDAVRQVIARVQHTAPGYQARTPEELAFYVRELGDLTTDEIRARSAGDADAWMQNLAQTERIREIEIPTARGMQRRWVAAEAEGAYRAAFTPHPQPLSQGERGVRPHPQPLSQEERGQGGEVLKRFLAFSAPVTRAEILARYAFDETWLDATLTRWEQAGELVRGHFTTRESEQWIDASLLEQIHRRTLNVLRGEVQPVSIFAYADFLARWQHAHPVTRLRDEHAAATILQQLRGVSLPGVVWERDILPARIAEYAEADWNELFENGNYVWVGAGVDGKRMRVRVFERGEGALFLAAADSNGLSDDARRAYEFLQGEGASFATDIQNGTHLSPDALANALLELTLRGLVTNDESETLRHLVEHGTVARGAARQAGGTKPLSALEAELDARLGPRPLKMTRYREMKRRTQERIARTLSQHGSAWRGRWALVQRASILGAPLSEQERAERLARVLLERYGVVTRTVLAREENLPLEIVYPVWQRMEWRGQVRRGIFVAGMPGAQYALPEAVEQLRAWSMERTPLGAEHAAGNAATAGNATATAGNATASVPYVLNAMDPANLFGGEGSDWKFARLPSTHVVLWRGQPVLIAQENGERLTTAFDVSADIVRAALRAYFTRPNAPRHAMVAEWNDETVLGSEGEMFLRELGFYRMPKGMERWGRVEN